ncbi:MAG: hypothetical protein R3E52_07510 [Burkholderiaceae bacterium]
MAPAASTTCTASYSVVQADLGAASIISTVVASGTWGTSNTPVQSPPASVTVRPRQTGVAPAPTLGSWGLAVTALLLADVGVFMLRRRHG